MLGSNPPPKVLALRSKNVAVPGYLADVDKYFLSCRLFVAPLRYGAGMKGKIGQALSYALPTVTTSIGAEGFRLRDGIDFLQAETTREFADAIVRLYSDASLWTTLSANSLRAIEPFSTARVAARVRDMMDEVCNDIPALT